jgi:hypothetical protein
MLRLAKGTPLAWAEHSPQVSPAEANWFRKKLGTQRQAALLSAFRRC